MPHGDCAASMVYVVDDDPDVRRSLRLIIESLKIGVQTCASATDFLPILDPTIPACLIVDVRLPGMTGLALLEHLRGTGNQIPAIVITAHADVASAVYAMRLGAFDFLEKPFSAALLIEQMQQALLLDTARHRYMHRQRHMRDRLDQLSERERQVLHLAAAGKLNKQIAAELRISIKTVEAHRAHIRGKLGVDSVIEMVRMIALAS